MKTDKDQSPVIELDDVETFPRITNDGYYTLAMTDAKWVHPQMNRLKLWVKFEVAEGSCKGARLQRGFYLTEKSVKSLSYLCAAVGIKGKLKDPNQLVGKKLVAQVNIRKDSSRAMLIPEPILFLPLSKKWLGHDETD